MIFNKMINLAILPFYMLLLYPIFGYLTWTLTNSQPFFLLFAFVLVSFVFTFTKTKKTYFPSYLKFFGLFVIVELMSKYLVHNTGLAINVNLKKSSFYVLSFILLLIVENTNFSSVFIKKSINIFSWLIIIAALVSAIQYFYPNFLINNIRQELSDVQTAGFQRRIGSIFTWGDHGYSIGLGVPIIFSILAAAYYNRKRALFLLSVTTGIVILLVQSRYAMVNYLIVLIWVYRKYFTIKRIGVGIGIIVAFTLSFILFIEIIGFDLQYFYKERVQSQTYQTRIEAFYAFENQFPKNPIWGTGGLVTTDLIKFYRRQTRIHNGYLSILYYYGIIGGIFYFSFLFLLVKKLFITARKSQYWGAFIGILCFLFTNFTLDINHFIEPGLIFMMVMNKYYRDKAKNHSKQNLKTGFNKNGK